MQAIDYLGIPYNRYGVNNKILERNHYEASELMVSDRLLPHHFHTQEWIVGFIRTVRSLYGHQVLLDLNLSFREPRRLSPYVNVSGQITHRPDWIIRIGASNQTINLEMDLGTMNQKKLTSKFLHYAEWFRDNPSSEPQIILFASHIERNVTRRKSIKSLALEFLGDYIRLGRLEVVEGSSTSTTNWLVWYLSRLMKSEVRDMFSESLKYYYDPDSSGSIAQYSYEEACQKLGHKLPYCDKVHFLTKPSAHNKHKVIFQLNTEPGSCQTEINCSELSAFAKSMSSDEIECYVCLVYSSPEKRMSDVQVLPTNNNVYATDLHTLSQKGLKHAWQWHLSKGWKRVEVDFLE